MKKVLTCLAALIFILFLITVRFGLIARMQSVANDNEASAAFVCAAPPANLSAWYPGDGNTHDITGGNNGTLQNGAAFADGKVEQAFSLDGVDDYVQVADNPAASVTGSLTINAWVNLRAHATGNNFSPIVSKWNSLNGASNQSYFLGINREGNAYFCASGPGWAACTGSGGFNTMPLNTFTHIAAVFNSGEHTLRIYINGIESGTMNNVNHSTINDNSEPLLIGAADYGQFVNARQFTNGLIDEVDIYNRALSQSEIQAIFNAGSAGKCKPTSNDWNATSGFLPDRKCPPYNLLDTAEPEIPVLSANKLTLSTSDDPEVMVYQQTAPYISFSEPTFIEARTRFVSGSNSALNRRHISIHFTTAPTVGNALFIGQDEIFLLADGDVRGMSAAVDTNDAFHTYRINIQTDGSINVLYDGSPVLTGSTFIHPQTHAGTPRIGWGDITSHAYGISEWEFFRHNAGRGLPPDCPSPITPDLQVTASNAPNEVETESVFDVSWTDKNTGQVQAEGPWVDKVYFSIDNQSGNDTLLGEFPFTGSLDPNQTSERIQSISIPRSVIAQDGDYFLIVQTDANNNVNEGSGENNNLTTRPLHVNRQPLPDLVVDNIKAPNEAFFEQTISVQWNVKNNGNASTNAGEWTDQIFLSTDATMSGDDSNLGGRLNVSYLNAGESYVAIADVNIPRGVFGSMYLIVKTDSNHNVGEDSETNNERAEAINIQIPPLPDLKVTNVIAPEETFVGGQIALTYRVENQGNRDTSPVGLPNSWVDGVYLSQDQTLNEQSDRRVGECPHAGNLAQNQGYNANCTVNTPSDIAGNWYVFVKTDDLNVIYEFVNENNNSDYDRVQPGSPMLIRATPPDLIVTMINAPATGTAARNVTVSWTVRNQGAFDAAPSWFDRIYLSDDAVFNSTSDTPLASVFHGILAAGQEYNASAEVRLPSCISGTKYIFVMTDSGNQIFEYDPKTNAEQNNASAAQAITISLVPADLQITSVSNPNIGNAGQPIQVGWMVTNNGTGATIENTWQDQIYLSPTAAFNQNTALLIGGFARQGNLNQGESYARTENVTVPNQAQGNYFVFVKTDAHDSVEECTNDDDNLAAGATQTNINNNLPDLRISSVTPIGNTVAGSTITVNWTGQNAGTAPAQNPTRGDAVYFSSNNTLDGNDQLLALTVINGTLATGASYQAQAQVVIPIVAPGNYFVIIVADDRNFVFEGQHENNNASATVLPIVVPEVDLQVSNVNAPASAFSGQSMNVSWTVANAGMNPTIGTNWTDYVYLSRDQILDPTDRSIGFLSHQEMLPGGQSYQASLGVFVPAGFTGQWYLFVVTDNNNQIAESSENNNASSMHGLNLQLTPPADLIVSSVTAPPNAMPGESATFQWTVQNNGANPALGLWTDSVYLSTDATWSINDVLVGQDTRLGPVNAGQGYSANLTVNLPAVNLGQHFVIVRTDVRNRVRETDESNNTGVSSGQTIVDVTQLQLGAPLNTTLVTGQERYYRTNTPADETVRFSVDGQDGSSNELFTRFGAMASRSQYDFLFNRPNEPDQEIVVPSTQAGNYYNLLRGDYVPTNTPTPTIEQVSVKAEIIPFSITSVSPNRIGDNGQVTLTLRGAKFQNGATVKLVKNGTILTANKVTVLNSATVKARFIFTNALHGSYDVVLTNPRAAIATSAQAVTIETAAQMRVELNVNGVTQPRVGRTSPSDAVLINTGNIDIPYTNVRVKAEENINMVIRRPSETMPRQAALPQHDWENGSPFVMRYDGMTVDHFVVRDLEVGQILPFAISIGNFEDHPFLLKIEAKLYSTDEFVMEMSVRAEEMRQGLLALPNSNYPSHIYPLLNDAAQWWNHHVEEFFIPLGYFDSVPMTPFINNNAQDRNVQYPRVANNCDDPVPSLACTASLLGFVGSCVISLPTLIGPAVACTGGALGTGLVCNYAANEQAGCPLPFCGSPWKLIGIAIGGSVTTAGAAALICAIAPRDPNDKSGPSGFGPQSFIAVQQQLPYTINFENVSTATAAAQRIRITDQLDPNLDRRTFRLKELGFGSYRITVPENRAFFQQRIQLGAEFNNLLADISAGVDIATGKVTWTLTAIDPATGEQPNSASLGLLPPNDATGRGQGYVTYTVQPKSNAQTGAVITNNATIIFDTEEPIITNTVTNTLDADAPVSAVAPLPVISQQTFTLSWAGEDIAGGSGLQSYDIWVAENDGAYQPYLSGTTNTSAEFNGRPNSTYRFYSIARDNAGNAEAAPPAPDAMTTTDSGGAPNISVNDFTSTGSDARLVTGFTVSLSTASAMPVTVQYATSDNTAHAGEDYNAASGTLTFMPGETSKGISITILSDNVYEPEETFFINLHTPTNATILDGQGIGTIPNDDPQPAMSIADVSRVEGDSGVSNVTFTVTLSNPSNQTVTAQFMTLNGTATSGSDYTLTSGPVTFNPNQTTAAVTVSLIGDIRDEANETFSVVLKSASGASIGDAAGVCAIIDDDINSSDFDGDGKNDLAVSRPSAEGTSFTKWYILNSADSSIVQMYFGDATDIPVAGDYNGDGRKEIAVFRPAEGAWYISQGSAQNFIRVHWGANGDIPAPGDYDGDGKTDIAVFRPANAIWYVLRSSDNQLLAVQWGISTDKLAPSDYDGDGKTDFAVFRPSTGTWYILKSASNQLLAVQWGISTDKLAPADYDLDGKADIAVFRPVDGTWHILRSSDNGIISAFWGSDGDVPVAGDYDGDGKADIAVWRPMTGNYYILESSNNRSVAFNPDIVTSNAHWGQKGDVPVASRYIPEQ